MNPSSPRHVLSIKKPIVNRFYGCLFAAQLLQIGAAHAQESVNASTDVPTPTPATPTASTSLTEAGSIALALQRAEVANSIDGQVDVEEGRARAASAYPNPQLSYMREQTFGVLGTGEDYLSVAQVFDLGNRRGLQGQAGDLRARAARSDGEALRRVITQEVRLRFYDVIHRQERLAILERWTQRIEHALTIVTRREQRGDASSYDRQRLEREKTVALGRRETELAALDRARARLIALCGPSAGTSQATGSLLPSDDPAELAALRSRSASRPELLSLGLRAEASSLEAKAASRFWAPDLRVEGGWKGVDMGAAGRTDGFLLGAALSLPLWDQSSGQRRAAEGGAKADRARRALAESELSAELEGMRAEALRLREAALTFRTRSAELSESLARIAAAGYDGGELGLLELLDAYRGGVDDELTALDMAQSARRARIELDRVSGDTP